MQLLAQQSPSARNVRAVRRAFFNVETMRHLRLAAGDHILVRGNSGQDDSTHTASKEVVESPVSQTGSIDGLMDCDGALTKLFGISVGDE